MAAFAKIVLASGLLMGLLMNGRVGGVSILKLLLIVGGLNVVVRLVMMVKESTSASIA